MTDSERDKIFRRLPNTGIQPQPPEVDEAVVRQVSHSSSEELLGRFERAILGLGDRLFSFPDWASAEIWMEKEATENNFQSAIRSPELNNHFNKLPLSWLNAGERDSAFEADFGICLSPRAIAESGTFAIISRNQRELFPSIIPKHSYVILEKKNILPDLYDGILFQKSLETDANIVWITGSSRTGDIDGILIHGAHGPKYLTILVIGETE